MSQQQMLESLMKVFIEMNKNEIIEWLYRDSNFNESIIKICPDIKWRDDLKGEFFLILSEKSDDQIIKMWNEKYLLKWSVSVLQNQYHSKTSPFYKKYRSNLDYDMDLNEIEDKKIEYEDVISMVEYILDNEIHWFDSHLFKLYYLQTIDKNGEIRKPLSTRKIEELHKFNNLKIDHTSVHKSVKKTLNIVKEKLKEKGIEWK